MNNKIKLVTTGAVLIGITLLGAASVYAQSSGQYSNLVSMIAQKFNLKQADVQAVFDSARAQQKTNMQNKFNANLDQAVKDGKLTEAQKQLILQKRQELQNARQNLKNMTADQRKAAMSQQKTDLQNWAKANGIDIKYLFGFGGRMGGMGMKGASGWEK